MTSTDRTSISIAPDREGAPLSKAQKAFNALVKKIEVRRKRLGDWEVALPLYHRKYVSQMVPLEQSAIALQTRLVHRMDEAYGQKGLNKTELATMAEFIAELAGKLVVHSDDPALKAIYNRYSGSDFDEETAAGMDELKASLEATFGVELGDDVDLGSPEEVLRHVQEQLDRREEEEAAARRAHQERRAERKKTPKQAAAEARKQAEKDETSVSIREVYRKLASALHPDRETDLTERERKTDLMKRVNEAYAKKSLLQLLELQLELEHIDQASIDNMGDDRLKSYSKILKEQLGGLDDEIRRVEDDFRRAYDMPPFEPVSPGTINRHLTSEILALRDGVKGVEDDLRVFDHQGNLKAWLKSLKWAMRNQRFHDFGV